MSQILYGKPVAENLDFKSKTIFENYTTNNDKPDETNDKSSETNDASNEITSQKQ